MGYPEQYRILIEAVRLLAASSDIQISVLPDFVDKVEEIAINYDDAYLLVPQLIEKNMLSESVAIYLKKISTGLDVIFEDENLCTLQALKESIQWDEIRSLSYKVLSQMNETQAPVNLSHITWVKG